MERSGTLGTCKKRGVDLKERKRLFKDSSNSGSGQGELDVCGLNYLALLAALVRCCFALSR